MSHYKQLYSTRHRIQTLLLRLVLYSSHLLSTAYYSIILRNLPTAAPNQNNLFKYSLSTKNKEMTTSSHCYHKSLTFIDIKPKKKKGEKSYGTQRAVA